MDTLIDNDIIFKAACYDVFDALLIQVVTSPSSAGILGAAKYVAQKAIEKSGLNGDAAEALRRLRRFIDNASIIEPTDEEQSLAADFERAAQMAGVALDTGESQLCAVLITRSLNWICTGDKRAIQAMEQLLHCDSRLNFIAGKIICFEQLVRTAITHDLPMFRAAICSEPKVDKTLTICFSCSSPEITFDEVVEGLKSYINDLRTKAPNVLSA